MAVARKDTVKKLDPQDVTVADLRSVPTEEEHKAKAKENAPVKNLDNLIKVKTVSGGDMYDPEGDQWIGGNLNLAVDTDWIRYQAEAKKLEIVK